MKRTIPLLLAVLAATLVRAQARPQPPTIFTGFYPLQFFAERIAGDAARVICPVPAGDDPVTWRPTRAEVRRMQEARLVFVHHASFEQWPGYVSLPLARTVVAMRPLEDRLLVYDEGAAHSHGKDGPPAHRRIDGHSWLDPELAREEARVVLEALQASFPAHAGAFADRYARLLVSFEVWRAAVVELSGRLGDELLIANHPAYEYLAHGYGWHVENVELDPEVLFDDGARERLVRLRERGARLVLWESAPGEPVRRALERIGLASVVYSPCETLAPVRSGAGEDFFSVMMGNVARLREALQAPR